MNTNAHPFLIEDLKPANMVRNHCLAFSIADASWGIVRHYLECKAEHAGRKLIAVAPHYTSQQCSHCGEYVQKSLSVRTHVCPFCGYIADRDENAARNILQRGLQVLAGTPPSSSRREDVSQDMELPPMLKREATDLARRLASEVERVDAVDFSQVMLEKGRTLPGGNHPHLNWMYGRLEDVALHPPYALITAGESLHWMEWEVVLPLFHHILTPHGYLAIVERGTEYSLWDDDLRAIIPRFATNKEYRPYDLIDELEQRHLFQKHGAIRTRPVSFIQSGEEYIRSIHSRNGFSRERMGEEVADIFDEEVRKMITPFLQGGLLTLSVVSEVVWGTPKVLPPVPVHS